MSTLYFCIFVLPFDISALRFRPNCFLDSSHKDLSFVVMTCQVICFNFCAVQQEYWLSSVPEFFQNISKHKKQYRYRYHVLANAADDRFYLRFSERIVELKIFCAEPYVVIIFKIKIVPFRCGSTAAIHWLSAHRHG